MYSDPFSSSFGVFDMMFTIVPIFVFLVFAIVITMLIINIVKGTKEWSRNNASPVLTVEVTIVAKRQDVSYYHHNNNGNNHHSSSTTYYVTFEVESGDRMELKVADKEYGLLVEGDIERLTFQGTRYQGFERISE